MLPLASKYCPVPFLAAGSASMVSILENICFPEKYKHITVDWPDSYINFTISQLITHRIFKMNDLIHKCIHHSYIKSLSAEHQLAYWTSGNGPLDTKFESINLKDKFFTAWNKHVYEMKLKRHHSFSHFAWHITMSIVR